MYFKKKAPLFLVVILGPDGVGKTTSIDECKKELHKKQFSYIAKHHVWGDLSERPKHLQYEKKMNVIINILNKTFLRKVVNYLIVNLNIIKEEIRYVVKLNRMVSEAAKKYSIIIIDRYIFDKVAIKEARKTRDLQYLARKFLTYFTFTPDLSIVLSNSPLVIHKRKYELSIEEARLYLSSIKRIAKSRSYNFNDVITDKLPQVIGKEIFDSINKYNTNNRFYIKTSSDQIDLNDFFKLISDIPYVVLKNDTPYSVNDFPNRYPYGKDLDILTNKTDFNNIALITKDFSKEYKKYFSIRIIKDSKYKIRFRFEEGKRLHYQIDISATINITDVDILKRIIETRVKIRNYYIPCEKYEVWVRIMEHYFNKQKEHHLEYIKKHSNSIDYSLVKDFVIVEYAKKIINETI